MAVAGASHAYDFEVGNTTASIGGYVKLDFIYDVDADLGPVVAHENIRLDDEEGADGHTNLHARQSRIAFQTTTPVGGSTLKTHIEGDFFGSSASGAPDLRLRHAYGSWNGILAGQTWSNFGTFIDFTPTIDFNGLLGQGVILRQAQLRYTTGGFSVALEDPATLGGAVAVTDPTSDFDDKSEYPDLTAQYTGSAGNLQYAASAMLRQLQVADSSGDEDDEMGWGVQAAASMELTPGITVRGGIGHGDGIGGYLLGRSPRGDFQGLPIAAFVDSNGSVETVDSTGGNVGVSIAAGPGNVNLAYARLTSDFDDAVDDGALTADDKDRFSSFYANYIWSPAERISYGIEAGLHEVETQGGDEGDAVRLQGMVMYSF
nr:DcaP family trimeric outer membrane transporter [Halomonas cerina]